MIFTRTTPWEGGAEKEARTRRRGVSLELLCPRVMRNLAFSGARLGVRGDNDLHHSGFAFVEAVEPCGAFFERGNG